MNLFHFIVAEFDKLSKHTIFLRMSELYQELELKYNLLLDKYNVLKYNAQTLEEENFRLKREIEAMNQHIVSMIESDILHMKKQVAKINKPPIEELS